jgi:restriction endonuclease Mrr
MRRLTRALPLVSSRQKSRERSRSNTHDAERAEQQRQQRIENERQAKIPVNRLYWAYVSYSHVQLCHEARRGYAVTYVNDVELQRARTVAKAIEQRALAEDPKIDPDKTFAEADTFARGSDLPSGGFHPNSDACRAALVSPYQTQRP